METHYCASQYILLILIFLLDIVLKDNGVLSATTKPSPTKCPEGFGSYKTYCFGLIENSNRNEADKKCEELQKPIGAGHFQILMNDTDTATLFKQMETAYWIKTHKGDAALTTWFENGVVSEEEVVCLFQSYDDKNNQVYSNGIYIDHCYSQSYRHICFIDTIERHLPMIYFVDFDKFKDKYVKLMEPLEVSWYNANYSCETIYDKSRQITDFQGILPYLKNKMVSQANFWLGFRRTKNKPWQSLSGKFSDTIMHSSKFTTFKANQNGKYNYICKLFFPIDADWTQWESWNECDTSCRESGLFQHRHRDCILGLYGGKVKCEGISIEYRPCCAKITEEQQRKRDKVFAENTQASLFNNEYMAYFFIATFIMSTFIWIGLNVVHHQLNKTGELPDNYVLPCIHHR